MLHPIRSIAAPFVLIAVLAACGTASAPTSEPTSSPTATPTPSEAPSETPEASPEASPEVAGTLTMVDGVVADGPGESVAEALAAGRTEPTLVNGALFMDADGTIYLASGITDASAPTFEGPMLEVIGYPENTADWDMASADITGLQEANGIRFFEDAQLFGVVES